MISMSGAHSPAYFRFRGVSHYYHATVVGSSGRNRPYYMPSDWYAAIGRKEVIYAAELAVPRARSARRHKAVV
jgi:hypothetical protein